MSCSKRPFDSPQQAQAQLRVWQRNGRRAELDNAHVYKADCVHPAHRGKFHVGRKHDRGRGRPTKGSAVGQRNRIFEELDDLFDRQTVRVVRHLSKHEQRRRQRFRDEDDGPLCMPGHGKGNNTLGPGGDEIDVEERR